MKILKKLLSTFIFVAMLFGQQFCNPQPRERICVDKRVILAKDQPSAQIELQPTHPKYKTIEYEIDRLKRYNIRNTQKISLDDNSNKSIAPTLFGVISKPLAEICSKAGIKAPSVVIYVGNSNDSYNASADTCTEYWRETQTITQGKKVKTAVKYSETKECTLTLGEGLLKLLLWDIHGDEALKSIMAHEVGHMIQKEGMQPKVAEFDADASAVKFLGKANARQLIKSINMSTLSSHIFNTLAGQASIFRLSIDDIHQINRIITNSITKSYYELGDLGKCSSHTKFGHVINKVFQDALKYSFDPKVGLTEDNFFKIYEKLEKACKNMTDFMGADKDKLISAKCLYVEEYSNKYYSQITHPTPEQRYAHIKNCINHSL